jgi:hypothetical protein
VTIILFGPFLLLIVAGTGLALVAAIELDKSEGDEHPRQLLAPANRVYDSPEKR